MEDRINNLASLMQERVDASLKRKDEIKEIYLKALNSFQEEYFKKLEGTEKQVKWANSIKLQNFTNKLLQLVKVNFEIEEIEEKAKNLNENRAYQYYKEVKLNIIEDIKAYVENTSAKEIIETR